MGEHRPSALSCDAPSGVALTRPSGGFVVEGGTMFHSTIEAQYAVMSDVEVVLEFSKAIGEVGDDDEVTERLYWLLGEALERWAPEVEWAEAEHQHAYDKNRERELVDHREALDRRAHLRRVLRDALPRENGDA